MQGFKGFQGSEGLGFRGEDLGFRVEVSLGFRVEVSRTKRLLASKVTGPLSGSHRRSDRARSPNARRCADWSLQVYLEVHGA